MLGELCKGEVRLAFQIRCSRCGEEGHIAYTSGEQQYAAIRASEWTWSRLTHWICPICSAKSSYNPSALSELIQAATRIVRYPPMAYDHGQDRSYCVSCGTSCPVSDRETLSDESVHTDDCAWRLLKEAVANLDNEGYVAQEDSNESI